MNELIASLILSNASFYGVDPLLVASIIKVESNYNANAVGAIGERGLMQLRPEFFSISKEMLSEPAINIAFGVRHLKYKMEACKHLGKAAFTCYNTGGASGKKRTLAEATRSMYYVKVMKEHERLQWTALKLGMSSQLKGSIMGQQRVGVSSEQFSKMVKSKLKLGTRGRTSQLTRRK